MEMPDFCALACQRRSTFRSVIFLDGRRHQSVSVVQSNRDTMANISKCVRTFALTIPIVMATLAATPSADVLCGFYVAGTAQKLFNNATMGKQRTSRIRETQNSPRLEFG